MAGPIYGPALFMAGSIYGPVLFMAGSINGLFLKKAINSAGHNRTTKVFIMKYLALTN